ncbi:putative nitrate reductase, large subunit protein [Parvularcula bermudensis HTCC2503]|uniref:Putative nitrate reductase, large subunit protein n=2 Tax=Parvularcula TaxID=208215 RepID=E0THG3_PARBH|nr:putative nitrate reductase, large subunit protein [Parvularcula bermudensis HTCC2503]
MVDGQRTGWSAAMDRIARGFRDAIERHGPDSVAFYLSGQLLTEDYYVANKLMKGFIGSANVDTNSRLCMASAVAGHKRAFGSDTVPGTYEDLEACDLLVLVGSNLAWCHPVLYQRVLAAKEARPDLKIVVIDPRRTATCDLAEQHLAIAPGSDVALFSGLLRFLANSPARNDGYIAQYTSGMRDALEAAAAYDINRVARETRLPKDDLIRFYESVSRNERTVTLFSMGVNQAADGTDRVNAIINTHLVTGRIGKLGGGPFSITGQPNAMGGREVGGLSNQLACHMDFDDASVDRVRRFWRAPRMATRPGLKAVEMMDAVAAGRIKAIWIMATNPVVSMPNADAVKAALKACPLVVVSDIVPDTDTAQCADILLPATGWGEKDGTVTNSERRISRQRAFLPAPGLARHDWWAMSDLARRLGYEEAFGYENTASIFREYAALTAFENEGGRDLDLGGLAGLTDDEYDELSPVRWPVRRDGSRTERFFRRGGYFTPDRRARFVAPRTDEPKEEAPGLCLNTGRIRDHWHTMTRTGRAARLNKHIAEPFAEIHPDDAAAHGILDASLVRVKNDDGEAVVRALLTDRQQRGSVFVPMHWTGQAASQARVDTLVPPLVDPVSGQPALKSGRVTIEPYPAVWYGFAAGHVTPPTGETYWARAMTETGRRLELAGTSHPHDWSVFARELLSADEEDSETVEHMDAAGAHYRCAVFRGGRLRSVLLVGPTPVAAARDWLGDQIGKVASLNTRTSILAGVPGAGAPDPGPIVCSCLGVGANVIRRAMRDGASSLTQIGDRTGAGTNCGSCRPEIRKLMEIAHATT